MTPFGRPLFLLWPSWTFLAASGNW